MKRTLWLDRVFPPIEDNGLLPAILERLDGTTARLASKISRLKTGMPLPAAGKWSIKREIGHLADLEPLWLTRVNEIAAGLPQLTAADMSNKKTAEADHDERSWEELLASFSLQRSKLVKALGELNEAALNSAPLHPRLNRPMRAVDLAYFVAEHDDHHLALISSLMGSL